MAMTIKIVFYFKILLFFELIISSRFRL